jgi:hypothetical protein
LGTKNALLIFKISEQKSAFLHFVSPFEDKARRNSFRIQLVVHGDRNNVELI